MTPKEFVAKWSQIQQQERLLALNLERAGDQ